MPLPYSWDELSRVTSGTLLQESDSPAGRFSVDSRNVGPGDVFVALKGERVDGHDFLKAACDRGVAGVIVSRRPGPLPDGVSVLCVDDALVALHALARFHRARCPAKVIGITGSNGKTTTKDMIAHVLKAGGKRVLSTRGNLNSRIGLPLVLLELDRSHTHAVIEMGASTRGDIQFLATMAKPQMGVLTGIGRAHIEHFGSLENTLSAKWELAESLPADGVLFLNGDDERLMSKKAAAPCPVVTFGLKEGADLWGRNIQQDPRVRFDLVMGLSTRPVNLPVPGEFNVRNALAAAAVGLWEKIPMPTLIAALADFPAPPGRMQICKRVDGTVFLLDAYNANPDSMAAGLRSFVSAYPERPRWVVAGSMLELGPDAEKEHRALGTLLATLSVSRVYFVGAESAWVREAFEKAGGRASLWAGTDRATLRNLLEKDIEPGAAIFFKGSRGARLEEIYDPLLGG